jgi:uncharacterized protein YdcH (DUF465 family)
MFPEYRELISRLKTTHPRFQSLFEIEGVDGKGYSLELVHMKKEKLLLKDEMLKILQHENLNQA